MPWNLLADENFRQYYSFVGENFRITSEGENFSPAIASNGKDIFLVVYYRKNTNDFDIYGTRVTVDGEVLDPDGIPISTAPGDQMFPSVTWNEENFFVVWQDYRSGKNWDIFGARVNVSGEVLDPDGIPLVIGKPKLDHVSPVVLNEVLVWQGRRDPKTWNIFFKKLGENEEEVENFPIIISPSKKSQISPSVVFNSKLYFIVWQDKRENAWEIYGARVTSWGEVIDKKGIKISTMKNFEKWRPVVSWNRNYYLILWMASPDEKKWSLYGKRVNSQGEFIEFIEFPILEEGSNKGFPTILCNGGEHLLIVFEEEPEGNTKVLALSLIDINKKMLFSETILISMNNRLEKSVFPSVSSMNNKILIAWQGKGNDTPYQIFGQIISIFKGGKEN